MIAREMIKIVCLLSTILVDNKQIKSIGRMNKGVIILLFLLLSIACNNKITIIQELGKGEIIAIDPKEFVQQHAMASFLVDSIEYIPLETTNESLIGRIKAIHEWNGRFYICDEQSDAIFIFNNQGEYLKKLAAKGRGPKEYIAIRSFYQNSKTGDLYIYCDRSLSILHYDAEGIFIERIPCKYITTDFVLLGKDSLVLYGGKMPNQNIFSKTFPKQWRLILLKEDSIIKKDFAGTYKDVLLNDVGKQRNFSCFSDSILLMETIGNDIYRLNSNGEISPRFTIDFGKYTYPLTFDKSNEESLEIIKSIKDGKEWCKLIDFWETENTLLMKYSYQSFVLTAIYSKGTKKSYNIGPVWANDIDRVPMPTIHASGKDYFLGSIESHVILYSLENLNKPSDRIKHIAQNLTEMDNPIIVKVKMKNF